MQVKTKRLLIKLFSILGLIFLGVFVASAEITQEEVDNFVKSDETLHLHHNTNEFASASFWYPTITPQYTSSSLSDDQIIYEDVPIKVYSGDAISHYKTDIIDALTDTRLYPFSVSYRALSPLQLSILDVGTANSRIELGENPSGQTVLFDFSYEDRVKTLAYTFFPSEIAQYSFKMGDGSALSGNNWRYWFEAGVAVSFGRFANDAMYESPYHPECCNEDAKVYPTAYRVRHTRGDDPYSDDDIRSISGIRALPNESGFFDSFLAEALSCCSISKSAKTNNRGSQCLAVAPHYVLRFDGIHNEYVPASTPPDGTDPLFEVLNNDDPSYDLPDSKLKKHLFLSDISNGPMGKVADIGGGVSLYCVGMRRRREPPDFTYTYAAQSTIHDSNIAKFLNFKDFDSATWSRLQCQLGVTTSCHETVHNVLISSMPIDDADNSVSDFPTGTNLVAVGTMQLPLARPSWEGSPAYTSSNFAVFDRFYQDYGTLMGLENGRHTAHSNDIGRVFGFYYNWYDKGKFIPVGMNCQILENGTKSNINFLDSAIQKKIKDAVEKHSREVLGQEETIRFYSVDDLQ